MSMPIMPNKLVTIASNAVLAKLHEPTREVKLEVQRLLSYLVAGSDQSDLFKKGHWDGRSSFLDFKTGTFPAGFVHYVMAGLARAGYKPKLVRNPLPEALGPLVPVVDSFPDDPRYDFQMGVVEKLIKHGNGIAQIATGGGKCLGKDTPVLMFDGTIKNVQDVLTGDLLMGPDSTPRTVLSVCSGRSNLYRVTPVKGEPYVVNDAHILSLKKTSRGYRGLLRDGDKYPKGGVVNINVEDYLAQSKTFKHTHKGWRTGVEFRSTAPLLVDPYLLGVILGDGSISGTVSVTTADAEIQSMLESQASEWGLLCNAIPKSENAASAIYLTAGRTGGKANPLMVALRELGFASVDNKAAKKFVPYSYKTASRNARLALLAGVLDTDGYFDGKCMYLTLKEERLFDDVLFVVRSLGFSAYKSVCQKTCCNNGVVGTYFSMTISGDLSQIPVRLERRKAPARLQKKDHLVTGLSVEAIGDGDYYGFELDGDHLFMLGDFTVTHNTRIAKLAYARINRPTLFLTTRSILMYQMKDAFEKDMGVQCSVLGDGQFGHTFVDKDGVTRQAVKKMSVGMVQTIVAKLADPDPRTTAQKQQQQRGEQSKMINLLSKFELVIGEEAHEASGNSYYEILKHCKNAHYRLALTATPFMKEEEESNMRLMAAFGPIIYRVSEQTLIDRGILAKPFFKYVKGLIKPPHLLKSTPWQSAYRLGITDNTERNTSIVKEATNAVAHKLPVMILVQHKSHGAHLLERLEAEGLRANFIFGDTAQDERKSVLRALERGAIDVLIGSTILDVGVDVPALGMVILAGGGKAEVALRQRIGRGLRAKKKGENVCFVVDFQDDSNKYLKRHAEQRLAIVQATPGFAENILPPGQDFPYSAIVESESLA